MKLLQPEKDMFTIQTPIRELQSTNEAEQELTNNQCFLFLYCLNFRYLLVYLIKYPYYIKYF